MINAIILASGYGKRMGNNKLLLPLKGKTIIEHVIDTISSCCFHDVLLVGRDEEVIKLSKNKGIRTVENKEAHKGQSESVKLGIIHSLPAEGYMFFTGDQPFVGKEHVEDIIKGFYMDRSRITVPRYGAERGTPVIFPAELKNELLSLEGDEGGRAVMRAYPERIRFIEMNDNELFFDIDTPEDYIHAQGRHE